MILSKKDAARNMADESCGSLICPVCKSVLRTSGYSVSCKNNHSYDIARKGYINLFGGTTKVSDIYNRQLFGARKKVADAGLYTRLNNVVADIMSAHAAGSGASVIDAGCGGGNILAEIMTICSGMKYYAVDLSKSGVEFAASVYGGVLWIVGNINRLPFADNAADILLNVMSPSNYSEFGRVLAADGILIKVVPAADYLKELREFIYRESDNKKYSNDDVITHLADNMRITREIPVSYTHTLCGDDVAALYDMTPLTAKTGENVRNEFISTHAGFTVTLAFNIAVCTPNK